MNDYTARITTLIEDQNISWAKVSRITGISERTLANCRKSNRYTSEQLDKIATALNITVSQLTDFGDEFSPMHNLYDKAEVFRQALVDDLDRIGERLEINNP